MSRHNHSTVFIHDERFSFNGAKISRIQRAYKIKTITSEIDLMTLGKDTQQTCSCCQASLVGLFVDSRQQCKCCGGVVCEECNSNPAVIQGQEFRGEKSVCDSCFAEKTQHRQYGYTVKPPTRGGSVDDERSAQLQKGRKIRVVHPVGLVTDPSVDNCMGCDAQFGWTVFKHHCRCCGNVMCSDCLPHCVKINELHSSAQKTCKFCYNEETISKETTVVLGDEEIQVRRVHVGTKADGTRGHVGWVLDECSDKCMGCTQKFSARRHKMHCRSCGDLVCQDCSTRAVNLGGRKQIGQQRVCDECYNHKRRASFHDKNGSLSCSDYLVDPLEVAKHRRSSVSRSTEGGGVSPLISEEEFEDSSYGSWRN